MEFTTDDFEVAASTICDLYKDRWDIELFFKQPKQTLKLSDFLGYSENAVQWQIWMALLTYVLYSECIQVLGKKLLLYRQNPKKKKITLPE